MATSSKSRSKIEFGDFQTPPDLARRVCELLDASSLTPAAVLEPTCGSGAFLVASAEVFPGARLIGAERNPEYVGAAVAALAHVRDRTSIIECDFFAQDWPALVRSLPDPLLVIGNPPWVTNSALASLGSANVPDKSNFRNHSGIDAITGKSNFDISEWMLLRVVEWLNGRHATMAMLVKTAVARKVLSSTWQDGRQLSKATMHRISAIAHFGANVDACLLRCDFRPGATSRECTVSDLMGDSQPSTFGYRDARLIADLDLYHQWRHFAGKSRLQWRSGIKHDSGAVMELRESEGRLLNGLGEIVDIEPTHLYPMLKTSQVAAASAPLPTRWMIVPQSHVGQDTAHLARTAPRTWAYLTSHAVTLNARGSSIYRKKPPFSIFGIGDYTFAEWKVGISGFYKKVQFRVIGPFENKPVVLDDLSYFVACEDQKHAEHIASILNSRPVREFYEAFIFWDSKRPISADLLSRLDVDRASAALNLGHVRRPDQPLFDSDEPPEIDAAQPPTAS